MLNIDRRFIKNFDWVTLSITILITLIGIMTIYSATRPLSAEEHSGFHIKQTTWLILGIIALFLIVSFDYVWLSRFSLYLYVMGIVLLITVLILGKTGMGVTAAMQVSIAAQACLPVLKLGLAGYRGWTSIVVYPGEFLVPREITDEAGIVHEYVEPISGEAWDGGPLLLSWADAQPGQPGYNVVIHEFTHKLDMANGDATGCRLSTAACTPTSVPDAGGRCSTTPSNA